MSRSEDLESPVPARRRFGRGRLILLLLALSLLPGLAAAAAPKAWERVPQAARTGAYALSGILIAAGVGMILTTHE